MPHDDTTPFDDVPPSVLVVDDDHDVLALVRLALERRGFVVRSACDLRSARDALGREAFDALVTDLHLPDGSGRSLLAEGRPSHLRFAAVMTGAGTRLDPPASRLAGFDAHLQKPVDLSLLVGALASSLARR